MLMAEYYNYLESEKNNIPWSPFDQMTANLLKSFIRIKKIEARDVVSLVQSIVMTRAILLRQFLSEGELQESSMDQERMPPKYRRYFSPYLITLTDFVYAGTPYSLKDTEGDKELTKFSKRYSSSQHIPYYEELAPRDPQGAVVEFFKGPFLPISQEMPEEERIWKPTEMLPRQL